jgi:hypothetical protein
VSATTEPAGANCAAGGVKLTSASGTSYVCHGAAAAILSDPAALALLNQTLLSHLRHYGLPSPLLDWSKSWYVALFFAFSEMPKEAKKAAIYIHLPPLKREPGQLFKAAPGIHRVIPGCNPNRRHFDQKCVHTISIQLHENKESFVPHEEAACGSFIAKIEILAPERDYIMKRLSDMGISRYKLYGDEDSLVKDLWDEKKAKLLRSK